MVVQVTNDGVSGNAECFFHVEGDSRGLHPLLFAPLHATHVQSRQMAHGRLETQVNKLSSVATFDANREMTPVKHTCMPVQSAIVCVCVGCSRLACAQIKTVNNKGTRKQDNTQALLLLAKIFSTVSHQVRGETFRREIHLCSSIH